MILQALEACYDLMAKDARFQIAPPGYSAQSCSFAVVIDCEGNYRGILDLRVEKRGPQKIVPLQKGRAGKNPPPYFLCENCKYLFGTVYDKAKKELEDCTIALAAAEHLHHSILGELDDMGAKAVLHFFKRRQQKEELPIEPTHDFYSSGFAVLRLEGEDGFLHERPAIRRAWEIYASTASEDTSLGQCLLTGDKDVPLARTHTLLKGVLGGKATGGSLVGFNFKSVESYGKSQGYNAPVSAAAMFRYTTALNALLASDENRLLMGDMSCVLWTQKEVAGDTMGAFNALFSGELPEDKRIELDAKGAKQARHVLLRTMYGREITDEMLQIPVYILGLAPNIARLSVRFWYKDTFGAFVAHVAEHLLDMEISKSEKAKPFVSIRDLLQTMAVGGKSKNVPKTMQHALLTAITSGGPYPSGVYAHILLRIRAEVGEDFSINRTRAAYIKAYLKRYRRKNTRADEEELTVALNENSASTAYQLGRLFSVLELLQERAGNKNLRERYFATASTNPKTVFPAILKLAQSHLSKVQKESSKSGIFFDQLCGEILDKVEETKGFPVSFTLEEQGLFILGYYHQKQVLFQKKPTEDIAAQPIADEQAN